MRQRCFLMRKQSASPHFEPHGAPLLLKRRQLAESLGVTERTVAEWDLTGKIPAIRIGRTVRYSAEDVLAWLRKTGGAR